MDEVVAQDVPETLAGFIREVCGVRPEALRALAPPELPERERQLLVHANDMTTTLATFHGSALSVDILHCRAQGEVYLREVFLRTQPANRVVEYGVIAIALEQFDDDARQIIRAGRTPLGSLLHQFKIPFVSAPIGFFSVESESLAATRFALPPAATCYGRFNRLAKPSGEPLAWILEILPPP